MDGALGCALARPAGTVWPYQTAKRRYYRWIEAGVFDRLDCDLRPRTGAQGRTSSKYILDPDNNLIEVKIRTAIASATTVALAAGVGIGVGYALGQEDDDLRTGPGRPAPGTFVLANSSLERATPSDTHHP